MARQGIPRLLDLANAAGQLHPAFMPGTRRGHIRALHLNDPQLGFTVAQAKGADR